jgi:hypothetical protein
LVLLGLLYHFPAYNTTVKTGEYYLLSTGYYSARCSGIYAKKRDIQDKMTAEDEWKGILTRFPGTE